MVLGVDTDIGRKQERSLGERTKDLLLPRRANGETPRGEQLLSGHKATEPGGQEACLLRSQESYRSGKRREQPRRQGKSKATFPKAWDLL